ncbi:MAG: hypothetical protein CL484_11630 [Acidobacteria bacterium]|nr:hypothetical protein [Acidobacteriota bacterium]|tara:strand:+ start:2678 stop:4123 length:1446 start_codon:yes stop_codon:yes gene_type:complete
MIASAVLPSLCWLGLKEKDLMTIKTLVNMWSGGGSLFGLALLLWIVGGQAASMQTPEQNERHRVPADFMSFRGAQWLERTERAQEEQPEAVLDAMGLESGDIVADIGCGSGYYARRIVERVGSNGRVYCVDIQPEMLDIMRQLAERDGVSGIVPILSEPDDLKLPFGVVDWIVLADVYHEMSNYEQMLADMRSSLAPGGRVALLEYRVEDGTGDNLKSDHAMSVRQVLAEWLPAGFALENLHEFLPGQHLFIMKVDDGTVVPSESIRSLDLFEAIDQGLVEVEAVGAGDSRVTLRIRNLSGKKSLVTMPVGVLFRASQGRRDMVSRRDAAIRLFDDDWKDWNVRSVGLQLNRMAAEPSDDLTVEQRLYSADLEELMYVIQAGNYQVDDSPLFYIPRFHDIEQIAVSIAAEDLRYEDIAAAVKSERIPLQYGVAFALVYCDLAGIDVKGKRIWEAHEQIFRRLRDPGLAAWYQVKIGRLVER